MGEEEMDADVGRDLVLLSLLWGRLGNKGEDEERAGFGEGGIEAEFLSRREISASASRIQDGGSAGALPLALGLGFGDCWGAKSRLRT